VKPIQTYNPPATDLEKVTEERTEELNQTNVYRAKSQLNKEKTNPTKIGA